MPVDAVIFDWGGTLTSHQVTVDDIVDNWAAAARVLAPDHPGELAGLLFAADQGLWDRARGDHRSFSLADVFDRALADLAAGGAHVAPDEGQVARAADAYLAAWESTIVHDPEAVDVLTDLRRRGVRTGLLSNTFWPGAFHDRVLARDRLGDLLVACRYSCDLPNLKPHRAAFQAVLDALDVGDPGRAVFVGDRADDDIAGARAVGMRTVWRPNVADPFAPPPPDEQPDAVISSLRELVTLVDAWS